MNEKLQQIVGLLKNAPELAKMAPVIAKPLAEQALKQARAQARELGENPLLHDAAEQLRQVPALKPAVDIAADLWKHYIGCNDCKADAAGQPLTESYADPHDEPMAEPVKPVAAKPAPVKPASVQIATAKSAPAKSAKAKSAAKSAAKPSATTATNAAAKPKAKAATNAAAKPAAKAAAAPATFNPPPPVGPQTTAKPELKSAPAKKASPGASARPAPRNNAKALRQADLESLSKADLMRLADERGIATRKSQSREEIVAALTAKKG